MSFKLYGEYSALTSRDVSRARLERWLLRHSRREEEVVFTSPLTVKVYEEVKEKRKEEVDLETGRRRSFVEEVRYEVLDLTGDTPGKRGSQRAPLQPLPCQNSKANNSADTAKTSSQQSSIIKSPLSFLDTSCPRFPDVSVLCLSSPSPTPGPAPSARVLTPGPRTSRTSRSSRDALTKFPLLR